MATRCQLTDSGRLAVAAAAAETTWRHVLRGQTDRRTDGRTDGRTDRCRLTKGSAFTSYYAICSPDPSIINTVKPQLE